ncbi:hypothetical protein [Paraburkholderia sp.]|uniref:hypothetical protein n=1 Tax=Paraburkholderia sp. TaxID=1926495 RepID=UPI0039C936D9
MERLMTSEFSVAHRRKAQQLLQGQHAGLDVARVGAARARLSTLNSCQKRVDRCKLPQHRVFELLYRLGWQTQCVDDQRDRDRVVDCNPHP